MTANMKRAFCLWKTYKTQTEEYKQLAEQLNTTVLDLNAKCSQINGQRIFKTK